MGHLCGKLGRETVLFALLIPLGNPFVRAERVVSAPESLASGEILSLGVNTSVVVNVRLEAVLGLVGVGETSVESGGLENSGLTFFGRHFEETD